MNPAPSQATVKAFATPTVDRWRLMASEAAAAPGFMTLCAVRMGGVVVDFAWDFASASAARLLRRTVDELVGRRLLDELHDLQCQALVFEQYRAVLERTTSEAVEHVHLVNGVEDLHRHDAVRLGDGVAVVLSNLGASARAQTLRQALLRGDMARAGERADDQS
jgi:PAS fold